MTFFLTLNFPTCFIYYSEMQVTLIFIKSKLDFILVIFYFNFFNFFPAGMDYTMRLLVLTLTIFCIIAVTFFFYITFKSLVYCINYWQDCTSAILVLFIYVSSIY